METNTEFMPEESIDREYCKKMAKNITGTSKGAIIGIVSDAAERLHSQGREQVVVLDVGCADGAFTQTLSLQLPDYVKIIGIEKNLNRFERAKCLGNNNLEFLKEDFTKLFVDDFHIKYGLADIVIFSSVMHEIASDHNNGADLQYSPIPIVSALRYANDILSRDGYVVVRDFVKSPLSETRYVAVEFSNSGILDDLKTFLSIRRAPLLGQMSALKIPYTIREDVLMEFLMCETWGADNRDREILEKKLIMDNAQWAQAFKDARFEITHESSSQETYPEYFSKLVRIINPKPFEWPDFTFIKAGRKICLHS